MVFYQPSNSSHGNCNVYRYENIYLRHHFHKNHEFIYVEKGEMNMTEIASESGFGSVRNFIRVYKSFAGKAPGED